MRQTLFASISILTLLSSTAVIAQSAEDSAFDKRGGFIVDSQGDCVRTKWMGENDPCAPAAEPAPTPVAEPAPAPEPAPTVSREARTIYFDFDSAAITTESAAKLDELANIVNSSKAIKDVRVHGFTDQFGKDDYNLALAGKRAAAVKTYLDSRARIDASLAEVKGLGKATPEGGCETLASRSEKIACMAKERRVEIEFVSEK